MFKQRVYDIRNHRFHSLKENNYDNNDHKFHSLKENNYDINYHNWLVVQEVGVECRFSPHWANVVQREMESKNQIPLSKRQRYSTLDEPNSICWKHSPLIMMESLFLILNHVNNFLTINYLSLFYWFVYLKRTNHKLSCICYKKVVKKLLKEHFSLILDFKCYWKILSFSWN